MTSAVRKHRLNPFKVLVLLSYGEYDFVTWRSDTEVEIRNGPFARLLRVPNCRLQEYLEWLSHWGYITELDTSQYGISRCNVTKPYRWQSPEEIHASI